MRNLIAFFQRFRIFLLFLLLQLIALGSYFSVVSYPRTTFFNTSSRFMGALLELERGITKYWYLDAANQLLQEENAALNKKLPSSYISVDPKTKIINDTILKLSFEKIPATVINSTHTHQNNYFTINAGRKKGVTTKMGVVSSDGVVGIVYSTSDHYSLVKSILTEDINISAYIEDAKAFGLIKYQTNDPRRVNLTGISNDIPIRKSARILTRGSGGYFPPNLLIGKVESIESIEGKPLWNIKVRLEQDMRRLHYVYVIKNIHALELDELQRTVEELN